MFSLIGSDDKRQRVEGVKLYKEIASSPWNLTNRPITTLEKPVLNRDATKVQELCVRDKPVSKINLLILLILARVV